MTALLEYLDLTALLEYIDLLNRYSRGPSWGLQGPLSGWGPGRNAPVAPPPVGGPDYTFFLLLVYVVGSREAHFQALSSVQPLLYQNLLQ